MKEEFLLLRAAEAVDVLFVVGRAERGDAERLRFAAREQRRAVRTRQDGDGRLDGADLVGLAAVDAHAGADDVTAHDLRFGFLELFLEHQRISAVRVGFRFHELGLGGFAGDADSGVTIGFFLDLVGGGEIRAGNVLDRFQQRGVIRAFERERLLRGFLGQLDDRVDDGLERLVTGFHGAEHDFFRKLFGFGFNHHHTFSGAGDDEVELEVFHLLGGRVDDVLAILVADAGRCDRAGERCAGDHEGGGGGDHADHVGIVFLVVGKNRHGDLDFVLEAVGEQRTDRTVDEARGQRLLVGGTAFAFEVAAGNAASRVIALKVVHGQREEVLAFLRLPCVHDRRENSGLAISRQHSAVSLPRNAASFQRERTSRPIDRHAFNVKHLVFSLSAYENPPDPGGPAGVGGTGLAAQFQLFEDRLIATLVSRLQIVEQSATLRDHL